MIDDITCANCDGSGWANSIECVYCYGTGVKPEEVSNE